MTSSECLYSFSAQALTPFKQASLLVERQSDSLVASATHDHREYKLVARLLHTGFDVKVFLDPEDPRHLLSLTGAYRPRDALALTASHGIVGQLVTDLELSLDLTDDNIVRSKFFVRPNLLRDIKVRNTSSYLSCKNWFDVHDFYCVLCTVVRKSATSCGGGALRRRQ